MVTPLYIAQVKDELGLEKQYSFVDGGVAAKKRPQCLGKNMMRLWLHSSTSG